MEPDDSCLAVMEDRPDTNWAAISSTTRVRLRGVAEVVDEAVKFWDSEIDSQTIDKTFACLKAVKSSQGET